MKLYMCAKYDPDHGTVLSWHTSAKAAEAELLRHQRERGDEANGPEGVEQINIPTNRSGLVDWLNENLNRDNG